MNMNTNTLSRPSTQCVCECACVRACVRACVCVCVVVSVIVKHPVLPPCAVDGRSRNPLYYYLYCCCCCFTVMFKKARNSKYLNLNQA